MPTDLRLFTSRLARIALGGAVVGSALISGCAAGETPTSATSGGGGAATTSSAGTGGAASSSASATTVGATSSGSSTSATTGSSSSSGAGGDGGGSSTSVSASSASASASSASASGSGGGSSSSGAGGSDAPTGITLTGSNATPQFGNLNGGALYPDACPAGQVIIGFSGFLASQGYHGKMQASCGIPSVTGSGPFTVKISAGATTPLRGLFGVTAWSSMCAADQMVVGFGGRSGALLDALSLRCAPLVITGAPGAYTVAPGAITTLALVGDNGGNAFANTDCGVGQVATMARLRAGDGIDAFGIACSLVGLSY